MTSSCNSLESTDPSISSILLLEDSALPSSLVTESSLESSSLMTSSCNSLESTDPSICSILLLEHSALPSSLVTESSLESSLIASMVFSAGLYPSLGYSMISNVVSAESMSAVDSSCPSTFWSVISTIAEDSICFKSFVFSSSLISLPLLSFFSSSSSEVCLMLEEAKLSSMISPILLSC